MFAAHILVIDAFSPTTDGMKIAYLQSFVCAALSGVCAFIFETPKLSALLDAYIPILYTGVFSAGIAYMFQIEGQKNLPPAVASLIMSLESVVSAVSAWIILKQCMTAREITGAAIIFIAVLIAQIPKRKKKRA
jgi:drug/metabolite transporter (DMT)-like permease